MYSILVKTSKGSKDTNKTKLVSFRIPVFIEEQIDALVELGLFKDRSDFINYAIQKALFELVDKIVIPPSEDVVEIMLSLKPATPPFEDELYEVVKSVEEDVKSKFATSSSDRSKRGRVFRVRRANSKSSKNNEVAE